MQAAETIRPFQKDPDTRQKTDPALQHLSSEVAYRRKLQELGNRINSAVNLDAILIHSIEDIAALFDAERVTIYVLDGIKRQLVSRFKSGDEVEEIRIPVSSRSVIGYCAIEQRLMNIRNVYDKTELWAIDPGLDFETAYDQKSGSLTRQFLAYPIVHNKYLLGVLQLCNTKSGHPFTSRDETAVAELAGIIGIALFNQKRLSAAAKRNKFDYLIQNQLISQKEIDAAMATARTTKEPIEEVLIKNFNVPKKEIGLSLEQYYQVPFIEFHSNMPIPGELLAGLKVSFMEKNTWVPIGSEDGKVIIAIDNPNDLHRIDVIKSLFKNESLKFCVALRKDINEIIKNFTHDEKELAGIDEIISQLQDEASDIEESELSVGESDSAVVQVVNKIIIDAYSKNASDIHIEPYPGKQNTQVRLRVDGNCHVYQTIPFNYRNAVVARIKIMSNLDIAERRKPQDGKIQFKKYGGKDIELRVATVPTQGGMEDVVMRILAAGKPIPLENMGFSKYNMENFMQAIHQPYGIIFVCGPTGSGKTTTLHSALSRINKPETKIWTAEDPVEITQAGLRQVQVQPKIGFDFAAAMRAFLRADPDVIMVGEMRDKETTHIGIEASLTGHLVFSTLHTNSAPESITRLLDMGMDPFNFADAVLCILAQRLVLTLCKECKAPYHPNEKEYDDLVREYGKELFDRNVGIPYTDDLTLHKPNGCPACNQTGYRGRMGLHELLMGTDKMKRLIQGKAPVETIREQALQDGMTTLKQDGIEKIFGGYCDFAQVRKVTIK